jgi:hypothetical protein
MKQVEIGSKNCVEVDGDMVKIHNFSEAFPHHVDLLWLRVRGLSGIDYGALAKIQNLWSRRRTLPEGV